MYMLMFSTELSTTPLTYKTYWDVVMHNSSLSVVQPPIELDTLSECYPRTHLENELICECAAKTPNLKEVCLTEVV